MWPRLGGRIATLIDYRNKNPFHELTHPFCKSGHQYALDIASGKIDVCIYIKGAVERYFKDLEKGFFIFDRDKAERYLRTVQKFQHVKGKNWKTPHIHYEPWQNFAFMNIEGWVDPRTNERRFRIAHIEVPRGHGKSAMASQSVLYHLSCDNPKGNEISCASTKTEQARIVLDSSRAMAKGCPKYLSKTGTKVLAHKIVHPASNSFARALSADDKSLDGLNDVLSVIDELHAVSKDLFEVIYSGMSKRVDSLLLCITTAGFNTEGVGYSQSFYAKKVALGEVEDDQFFSLVYTLDEGDDIFDPKNWAKANPGLGVSVDPITFEAKVKKAKTVPSDIPNLKVKHFNVWISESRAYLDQGKWDNCADESLDINNYKKQRCYVGIDIASRVDLTAIVSVFKKDDEYHIFDNCYIPEQTVTESKSVLYENAVGSGHLIATTGEAIHLPRIQDDLKQISKDFKILSAFYDPWNATEMSQRLTSEGINMVEFRMNTANLSEPLKKLDELIRTGKIKHNNSPITRWCIGNIVAKEDAGGNVFPRKSHDRLKIDFVIALLMALAGWIQEEKNESVYESRGFRFIG